MTLHKVVYFSSIEGKSVHSISFFAGYLVAKASKQISVHRHTRHHFYKSSKHTPMAHTLASNNCQLQCSSVNHENQ